MDGLSAPTLAHSPRPTNFSQPAWWGSGLVSLGLHALALVLLTVTLETARSMERPAEADATIAVEMESPPREYFSDETAGLAGQALMAGEPAAATASDLLAALPEGPPPVDPQGILPAGSETAFLVGEDSGDASAAGYGRGD